MISVAVLCWVGQCFIEQLGLGLGEWTSEGSFAVYILDGLLCCHGCGSFLFNNSAWDWESGLQREGLTSAWDWESGLQRGYMGWAEWTTEGKIDV